MGSTGNPNPWAPYNTYKDCSLRICSIYCPQWCYLIFPPPPPPPEDDSGGSGPYFSPLVIAVIGILASAFLLVSYYTIITKYCRRRRNDGDFGDPNRDQMNNESWQSCTDGLDESVIKSITVCKYKRGDGLVEGTDCSVCLSEFQEDENLRLLPKCNHAFHLPCIDTWLKSHSSCPLCRSNIASVNPANVSPQQPAAPRQETCPPRDQNMPVNMHQTEGVSVIIRDDSERSSQNDIIISIVTNDASPGRTPIPAPEKGEASLSKIVQDDVQGIRRSVSLNSALSPDRFAIAGSSKKGQDECDAHHHHQIQVEISRFSIEEGFSRAHEGEEFRITEFSRNSNSERSPPAMKRSISTGKLVFGRYGRGRNLNGSTDPC